MLLYAMMKIIFTLYIYPHIFEKLKLPENVYGANTMECICVYVITIFQVKRQRLGSAVGAVAESEIMSS